MRQSYFKGGFLTVLILFCGAKGFSKRGCSVIDFTQFIDSTELVNRVKADVLSQKKTNIFLTFSVAHGMYYNLYVHNDPRISDIKRENIFYNDQRYFRHPAGENLSALMNWIKEQNSLSPKRTICVFGLDFGSPSKIDSRFEKRIHEYLYATILDSLDKFRFNEECNIYEVARNTTNYMKSHRKTLKKILKKDYRIWEKHFETLSEPQFLSNVVKRRDVMDSLALSNLDFLIKNKKNKFVVIGDSTFVRLLKSQRK